MCRGHHREVHRSGDEGAWWQKVRIDPAIAARILWLDTHPLLKQHQAGVKSAPETENNDSNYKTWR